MKLKLRIGQSVKFNLKVKSALDYPVDLYYLMDMSRSMKDDLASLKSLATRIADVIGNITCHWFVSEKSEHEFQHLAYIHDCCCKKTRNICIITVSHTFKGLYGSAM